MNIFIDDSGSFSWSKPGTSLFCGLTVPDRDLETLEDRWRRWKRSIFGNRGDELKGSALTERQLESFSYKVLPQEDRDVWLTYVGADTRRSREDIVAKYRDQSADTLRACSDLMKERKNQRQMQQYLEMSGWMRKRSTPNVMWLFALSRVIHESLQHSIVRFLEPEDDPEFRSFEITIDESFVSRRDEHLTFWMEWLRQRIRNDALVLEIPADWLQRDHPFPQMTKDGLCDVTSIYRDHMKFKKSHDVIGLQVADVCAHIAMRYYRGDRNLDLGGHPKPASCGHLKTGHLE
jgi:hypothetical protein